MDLFWILVGGITLGIGFIFFLRAIRLLVTIVNALFDFLEFKVNRKYKGKS